jgi:hypothetical protein
VSRLHPFTHAFGPVADAWFPAVRADAAASGRDLDDRGEFAHLGTVQDHLAALAGEADAETMEQYLSLLYAAFRFWDAGRRTLSPARAELEPLLDRAPGTPAIPGGACYVQLPERWWWSRVDDAAPFEPMDGFFAVSALHGREILVDAVLGLRAERDGFSQVAASVSSADLQAAGSAAPPPRFRPAMPGGTEAGLRSVNSVAELLLLASLALSPASE